MADQQRDPRIDPQPGDVLRKGKQERYVEHVSSGIEPDITYSSGLRHGYIFRCNWRRWARKAKVIHAA